MSAASLYLRAVVEVHPSDVALVKSIKKKARLSPTDQRSLMSELSQMRGTAGSVAHVTGFAMLVIPAGVVRGALQ